ncbi:MAG: hypothetical protein V2I56_11095, partial [Desulfobacteraceae bacterium]|nr:hypothetical protein [Desulfobacteraceae bacterium]
RWVRAAISMSEQMFMTILVQRWCAVDVTGGEQDRLVAAGTKRDFLRLRVRLPRPEAACQKK